MIKEAIGIGETIEEARQAACKELGVETFEAEFEILQQPEKKVFGLFGGNPAKVRVFVQSSPVDTASKFVKDVIKAMGIDSVTVEVKEQENGAEINLEGEDVGFIIGRRGDTLDALQYLTGLVANHVDNSYYRITINTGNYREKREKTLEILGRKLAFKAIKSGEKTALESMNPYERRIIHTAVQKVNGALSWSEGEDANRHVVIGPDPNAKKNYRQGGYNNNRSNGGNRRPYNNNNRGGYNNNNRGGYNNKGFNKPETTEQKDRKPLNEGGEFGLYGRIDNK